MELRNIITFQKIYELKCFSKAAAELGYSQSTVTMQMKQLESEFGVKLFDRIGKSVTVTNEGERLYKYAIDIIAAASNAKSDLTANPVPKGELRIGILESVCAAYLPQILYQYHSTYPEVSTIIKTGTFDELSSMLNAKRIDLLWTFDNPFEIPEWQKAFSYENRISVVCSPNHRLAQLPYATLPDIAEETFLLTEKSCSYRRLFEEQMAAKGYHLNVFLEIGNTDIIKKFAESNLGIAVLPAFTLIDELKSGRLKVLNLPDYQLHMQGQLFYHRNKWLSPAVREFIKLVSESSFE